MPYIPICLYYFLFLCFYFHLLFHSFLATTNILQFTMFDSISLQPTLNIWSSLIYSTSAWHKRHECNTTATLARRVRHEFDTSATRVLHERHECKTSGTRTTRVRHEWKILILITTQVKTYFHALIFTCIYLVIIFTKNYLLEIPHFHAKMVLKSAPQKLNFLIAKAISKLCTLDCSCKCHCTFPHSYAE